MGVLQDLTGSVVVTGASSGIGEQFARQLAARGVDLLLVARDARALEALRQELVGAHRDLRVDVLARDLATAGAGAEVAALAADRGIRVAGVVNNAGVGSHGRLVEQDPDEVARQVQLNCAAVVDLTRRFLPAMLEAGSGVVVNVASTAAFQPVPTMAVYGATKAFVLSFTEALEAETRSSGVRVLTLCPGPTETGFFRATGREFLTRGRQSPEEVVATALRAVDGRAPTVVTGLANRITSTGYRFLPRPVMTRLSARVVRSGS